MGTVLELKLRSSGDWTPFEKIQLESLMDCLPAKAASDLAFGVSDAGDPWCAVLNEDGDVVMHIARIQGRFFVHSTVEPFVADARDLPSAVAPFVENFRRPTSTVTALFDTTVPLHAYAAFDGAPPPVEYGADWTRDASDQPAEAFAPAGLPEAPDPSHAAPMMLVDNDAPGLADPAAAAAAGPQEADLGPAYLTQDDVSVSYELFFRDSGPIHADNAAADLVATQAANDEPAAPAFQLTAQADPQAPAGDNILTFPAPAPHAPVTTTLDATDATSIMHTEAVGDLLRAAAGNDVNIHPIDSGMIVAWDQPPPVDLAGVLPAAEAF
jgi:hypothetical protein